MEGKLNAMAKSNFFFLSFPIDLQATLYPSWFIFHLCNPTFYKIYKKNQAKASSHFPTAALWMYYALLNSNETLLITINSFGCLIESFYIGDNRVSTDGLWCDNRALQVKKAEFQKTQSFDPMVRRRMGTKEGGQRIQNQLQGQQIQFQGGKKSYAEVLVNGGASEREEVVIKTFEEGNGWGYESLVVTMRNFFAFKEFRAELYKREMKDVIVRECGGRLVVLTFSSVQQMKEGKAKLSAWGQEWCDSVKEWGEGHYAEQESRGNVIGLPPSQVNEEVD
ncbi:hypothetical protein HYC85_027812 [Camellia sinensis]|uniref:Uncharacterized protein n=1 Tax=Camellia sinensis TaxID=4442 RepID=A0A7J7FUF4_CAMSI|nr:hypothetical protein HYC85_027812 [Camellia sinensis]